MTPTNYDLPTYFHWLHWELRRLQCSPEDFQRMFEDVAARDKTRFVRVKPWGKLGDRKCDGLYWDEGTVYQVYSPDEMTSAETRRKIAEDLAGAVAYWKADLKRWVFVYNVRRGVAPDVARFLQEQRRKHRRITIEPMSNDDLWQIALALPFQSRVELLGPPPGLEKLFPLSALPQPIRSRLARQRFVVVQDILSPINLVDAIAAMKPATPFGPPLFLRPSSDASFSAAAAYQKAVVDDALERSRDRLPRFAVFSISPIPLVVHLGFLLSDRVEVEAYQYDRERRTWTWPPSNRPVEPIITEGVPEAELPDVTEAIIRVSLSAPIRPEDTIRHATPHAVAIDLSVAHPDVMWLEGPDQVVAVARAFRNAMADLRRCAPKLNRIHLFYAGPTPAAVAIGQAINPRMNPPIVVYQYDRKATPVYTPGLTIA